MNKVRLLFLVALMATANISFSQIHLKVEALPTGNGVFGVYARPCGTIQPTNNTITGSGQVTLKFQSAFTFANLTSLAGTWSQNAVVPNPSESIGFTYVSVGFLMDSPQIFYHEGQETLLFTFKLNGNGAATPALIQNGIDPFDQLPNSASSNPGNELTILDFGVQPLGLYTYVGNYVGSAPSNCTSEPQDTTIITPPIDTTDNTDTTTIIDTTGTTDTTTIIDTTGNTDTTVIDTTGSTDTTVINPPGDTTEQTSGVRELGKKTEYFKLYPTPANDWLNLRFLDPDLLGGTIKLYTLSGVLIGKTDKGARTEVKLNLAHLSSGLYLVIFERNGKTLQRDKFLKQ